MWCVIVNYSCLNNTYFSIIWIALFVKITIWKAMANWPGLTKANGERMGHAIVRAILAGRTGTTKLSASRPKQIETDHLGWRFGSGR
jgi:hypothetical protein